MGTVKLRFLNAADKSKENHGKPKESLEQKQQICASKVGAITRKYRSLQIIQLPKNMPYFI